MFYVVYLGHIFLKSSIVMWYYINKRAYLPLTCQMLTSFQNSFTMGHGSKFVTVVIKDPTIH